MRTVPLNWHWGSRVVIDSVFFGLTRPTDSTEIPNLLTWLNSESARLSQSWAQFDSCFITIYSIYWNILKGGGVQSTRPVDCCFFLKCYKYKENFNVSFRKKSGFNFKSSWLNSDSNASQHDSTLTRPESRAQISNKSGVHRWQLQAAPSEANFTEPKVCNYKDNLCNYKHFLFCFLNIYSLLIVI